MFRAGKFVLTRQRLRRLDGLDMGVLRRGRDDSALAELQIDRFAEVQVELHVLCPSSSGRWQVRHPKIDFRDSDLNLETLVFNWYSDIVVAVGSYLCWVDYCIGGILLCDAFDASSRLQYIPFPDKLPNLDRALHGRSVSELYQGVSVIEDHGFFKFAMVVQGDGQRFTPASGFKLTSWTMKITDEANMSWTIDSVLDSDDLWKLDDFARPEHHVLCVEGRKREGGDWLQDD
ncbi:uncharacterized protein [Miscanthus floridulus]|uniref:uncharacterized protein n=1 Tax=Miscanthus floridulus TaxID=154761 RepID=UPI0034594C20